MNEITSLKMKAISLINEIFVPLGLKPIEDLPKACPGNGKHCVLAVILQDNPSWGDIFVSSTSTTLNRHKINAKEIVFPTELVDFIREFDYGNIPDLISLESMDEYVCEADYDTYIRTLETMERNGIDIGTRLDIYKTDPRAVPLLAPSSTEEGID